MINKRIREVSSEKVQSRCALKQCMSLGPRPTIKYHIHNSTGQGESFLILHFIFFPILCFASTNDFNHERVVLIS